MKYNSAYWRKKFEDDVLGKEVSREKKERIIQWQLRNGT